MTGLGALALPQGKFHIRWANVQWLLLVLVWKLEMVERKIDSVIASGVAEQAPAEGLAGRIDPFGLRGGGTG